MSHIWVWLSWLLFFLGSVFVSVFSLSFCVPYNFLLKTRHWSNSFMPQNSHSFTSARLLLYEFFYQSKLGSGLHLKFVLPWFSSMQHSLPIYKTLYLGGWCFIRAKFVWFWILGFPFYCDSEITFLYAIFLLLSS